MGNGRPKEEAGKAEVGNGEVNKMETHLLAAKHAPELPTEAASADTWRAV